MTSGGIGTVPPKIYQLPTGWLGALRCLPGLTVSDVDETLLVTERGQLLEFSYTDMLCYAGPYSPAGVANAFKVLQRAFAALSPNQPPQRRSVVIRTAFQGPGARDGFEAVTRAVTDGRYTVDLALTRPDRGRLLRSFVFQISIAGRAATLLLRPGFVTAEFINLAGKSDRSPAEEANLDQLKAQLAQRILAVPAEDVYDVAG
jgi:hypothetical protein